MKSGVVINPALVGAGEEQFAPDKDICEGWKYYFAGTTEENRCVFSSIGEGKEQRTRMQLTDVGRWFRVFQEIEPNTLADEVCASITCGPKWRS